MLVPIRNFGIVKEGALYRSAQPLYDYEYAWLEKELGIKHIINLRAEANIDSKHVNKTNIVIHNIPVKDHHTPTDSQVEQFYELLDSLDGPILYHCEHGHGRTSLFTVLARLKQGWTIQEALDEEEKVFRYTFRHMEQLRWLDEFSCNFNIQTSSNQPASAL